MKLSISNIAWASAYDEQVYNYIRGQGFSGLEIAPTRIFSESPYCSLKEAKQFSESIMRDYGLRLSSMQSIWYGMTESIFGTPSERKTLLDYSKKAIDFAKEMNCSNLVFGCPKNRNIPEELEKSGYLFIASEFFDAIGDYATQANTHFSLEANPPIYGTNFMNTTIDAFEMCREVNNPGVRVNLDLGAMIYNNEVVDILDENIELVNHVHISEPYLKIIQKRNLHIELFQKLKELKYEKYISIEMGSVNGVEEVESTIDYIVELKNGI